MTELYTVFYLKPESVTIWSPCKLFIDKAGDRRAIIGRFLVHHNPISLPKWMCFRAKVIAMNIDT